ncbi:MAG: hypothetical protein ACD_42C00067G0002 [uncultured bacterium]|nr:MAG: hypothetical protein ACD_42C00067G0002 [uncultured bacterium]OGT25755.1 MAG: hypothetical protein A3B71_01300 [Gammaproteobacteria bacterium RIFCSPHIGHO2_02_FULL_42_43]OGT51703.1 MAG: hypothetical protein A3E54_03515 [Gammaproteobacteria bacterium RIFCSPHIGHO2_12_FULL_41_25]OGT61600.1 MAG: hypothetical protein A3I77_03320 [Gammaproteobacteria bacterium RIFCSPLOWO2_02_FULL_42_14]OGT86224.1 MAG: hypothetical protein A3G86_06170 [Gammaproteobacteria bacterium RIFCSPLOWO2_12_FULL_42_18]
MALMIGKFIEIKTGLSLQRARDILWNVHEVHIQDALTKNKFTLKTNLDEYNNSGLSRILKTHQMAEVRRRIQAQAWWESDS